MKYKIWIESEAKEFEFDDKKELYNFLEKVDLSKYKFKAWIKER